MNDTTADAPKLSWWKRLSSGLKRTSSSLGTAVADLVTKRKLDRAMLDDIEDVLLRADLGTEVAVRIADAVGAGRYDTPLPVSGDDELGFLLNSFNQMQRELERADARARRRGLPVPRARRARGSATHAVDRVGRQMISLRR